MSEDRNYESYRAERHRGNEPLALSALFNDAPALEARLQVERCAAKPGVDDPRALAVAHLNALSLAYSMSERHEWLTQQYRQACAETARFYRRAARALEGN